MKRIFILIISLLFISWVSQAQPAFSSLVVNGTNTQAVVTFSAVVGGNIEVDENLTPADFTVTISASTNGGTVSAGSVTVTVVHTAPSATATLTFNIPNASTADGSEILTVKPSGATNIYSAGGPMTGSETITANLKDLFAPVITSINRFNPATSLTNSATLIFRVTYNESVTGVAVGNFTAVLTDVTAGAITSVTGSGTTWDVTVPAVAITTLGVNGIVRLDADATPAVTDAAGNAFTGTKTGDQTYTVDQSPPAAPTVPNLQAGSDLGVSNTDDITSNNTPSFSVTGTNGLTLELLDGATVVSTITSNGASQTMTSSTLSDGLHSISARTTDAAGNSTTSSALDITIDTDPPGISSITPVQSISRGILLKTGTISASNSDTDVTGTGTLFLSELYVGAVLLQTNATVIGTVASITSNTALVLTGNAANNLTNAAFANMFYFTATFDEPMNSSTVTIADFAENGTGNLGSVVPASTGNPTSFYVHVSSLLGDNGTTQIDLNNTGYQDVAGNTATGTFTGTSATIDNTAPVFSAQSPAMGAFVNSSKVGYTLTEVNGPLASGTVTWTRISGTTDSGSPHVTPLAGTELNSGVRAYATLTNDTVNLKNGTVYSVAFTGTDNAGNVAATVTSTNVTVDELPPSDFTTGAVASTGGTVVAGYWNSTNTNLTVVVPIETADVSLTNGSVQIQWAKSSAPGVFNSVTGSGISTITGPQVTAGTKTVTVTAADLETAGFLAAEGETITIRAIITDRTGNSKTGANSASTFVVDQTFNAPSIPDLDAADDTGNNSDNITKNTTGLTFTGTSEPGATIQLRNNTTNIGSTVVADGSGNWSITVNLVAGTHPINARQTDVAGNPQSAASGNLSVTVDTTPPVITATAPANNAFVNHKRVSYTLSSAIASGSVTWTRTGGNLDPGTPHVMALTGTELTTGAHTNITLTNSPALVDGAVYSVTFNANDVADNPAVAVTNTGITYDITPPTIISASFFSSFNQDTDELFTTCNGTAPNHSSGSSREYVHLTISEPLNISDGALPSIVTASTSFGFNAAGYHASWAGTSYGTFDTSCDNRGGTAYHPTNVIHLQANFRTGSTDGLWSNTTTFSFTSGGSNVRDLAGNEMASVASISTVATAPKLASSMVLDPNPTGANTPERITFTVDQTLATSTAANAVTGITVDADGAGPGAAVSRPGTYSSTDNTVTVTSTADGQWTSATTVSYAAGNLTTTVPMASFGPERILLGPITITSNNANNTLAKEGNTISVTFTVNPGVLPLSGTPFSEATIGGIDVLSSITGSNPYTASLVTSGATPVPETSVAFSIAADQVGRITTVTKTIPGSMVTYDKTIPAKPAAPDLAADDDTGPGVGADSDNYTQTNSDLTFSGTVDNSSTTGLAATVTIYNNGVSIGTTTSDPVTGEWTFEAYPFPVTLADGTYNITIKVTDAAGNESLASDPLVLTIDNTPPNVVSILRVEPPVLNSWSTTNGTSSSTVTFRVTFDEDVSGIEYTGSLKNFEAVTSGNVSYTGISGASSTSSNYVDVSLTGVTGTGMLRLNFIDNDNVVNLVGYPVGGAGAQNFETDFTSDKDKYYTIVLAQPSASVTGFNQSTTTTSVTVNWSHAVGPLVQATHYLVRLKRSTSAFSPAVFTEGVPGGTPGNDGADYTDTDFSDGTLAAYVTYPNSNHTFIGLTSGILYNIEIYPLTYTSNYGTDNWDYRFTSPLTGNATTTTSPSSSVTLISAPASFSSVATALDGAVAPQSNAAQNFVFAIQDDGSTPNVDNAPFKFSSITILEGTGSSNAIADWTQAIESAQLTDGTTTVTVGNAAVATSPNRITFTVNPANLGFIADNGSKTYTLKIALKTSLGGTLPLNIDGKNFEFRVNASSFTHDNTGQISSTLLATGASSSVETGDANNQVTVSATAIAFTTQPSPTTVLVLTNFATPPVAKAVDANGNVDLGFTAPAVPSVTISNTGTLGMSTSSIVPANGVITFPPGFQYQGAGNGTLTLTGGGLNSNSGAGFIACSPVTVQYSSTSVITANALANSIESNKVTQATADAVFRFNVIDDNGPGGDGAPTRISQIVITQGPSNGSPPPSTIVAWKDVILGAVLTDNASNSYHLDSAAFAAAATNTTITFSGIANSATTDMGYVADGQTKIYTLSIYLKKAQVNPTTIDGRNLVFQVANTNLTVPAASSQISATTTNSGSTNNVIDVQATKLAFINQPASTLLVSKAISLQPPVPSLQATDAHGNRDLNYSMNLNITNVGVLQMSTTTPPQGPATSIIQTGSAGLYTFPGDFMYNQIGNGRLIATPSSGPVTAAQSNPVTVQVATSTRINSPSTSAATITSITNASPGSTVFTFSIKDDDSAENDGNPTLITEMVFTPSTLNNTVTDWSQAIAGARVEDSADPTKFIDILPVNILNNSLRFTGISTAVGALGRIADDATKTFNLRIWLKTNLGGTNNYPNTIDGLKFGFDLTSTNVTTDPNGTSLLAGLKANTTNVTTTVAVVASQLHITTPASAIFVSLSSPFTVVVQARDVNLNLDLDFEAANGIITSVTNATDATMVGTSGISIGTAGSGITFNTTSFTDGVFSFPAAFQFTTGNNNEDVTLSITAGGISTVPVSPGPAPFTPVLTLQTSSESAIVSDPTFAFTTNIPYHNYPEATNLTDANSFHLARALLVDGSRTNFAYSSSFGSGTLTTNTNNDGLPNEDSDGAATNLNSLTLRITNPANIRRIALFTNGGTQIGSEIAVDELKSVAFKDFTFSGSPLLTATNDSESEIRIGVSFWNDSIHVTDNKLIQVSIVAASLGDGSKFFPEPTNAAYIAGVDGGVTSVADVGLAAPANVNFIEVTATSLDFVTQPNDFAGINQPIDATTATSPPYTAIVHARDKFAVVDLDFNYTPSVTASANPVTSATFINGVLDLTGMQYNNAGAGKLTVQTSDPNNLNSNNTPWGTSIPCEPVDVINVTAVENTNGVLTTPNLKGGNVNQIIFGFTLNAQHFTASEPKLTGFSITFKDDNGNPYFYKTSSSTILKNFKILESTQGTAAGATSIAGIATITQTRSAQAISLYGPSATSFDMVTVVFTPSSNYRTLFDPANPLTYYLQVDVDVSTNIGTPPITPYLEDNGYSDIFTRDNVLLTEGSSQITPVVKGPTRSFASTKPPALVSSDPFNGQLNVDPAQNTITLFFDVPVTTFDGKAFLYDRYSNNLVATLTATNGIYQWAPGQPTSPSPYITNPLTFELPAGFDLIPDSVYYLTINQGRFDPNNPVDRAGISDDGFNLFGGISFNGTLYFKAASPNPPVMKGTDPLKYYFSKTTTTINASFNQRGTAHFMITNMGATAPDIAQIKGAAYSGGTVYGRGSFDITQIEPSYQYGTVNTSLTPGVTYDVFMFAENDALPQPIGTAAPYGSSGNGFVAGTTGPTLRFTAPSATASLTNFPRYQVCSNSYTQLSDPIVLSEVTNQQFTGTGIQSINILLPTGFQFDVNAQPSIQFNGTDFNNAILGSTPAYTFINTTILRISFGNNGATNSFDNIIISDLVVIANTPDITGFITRFSGNAIPALSDGAQFAQITSAADDPINFTNSYSIVSDFNLAPINIANTVTYIPDNYIDVTLNQSATRLFPLPPSGDYGPTFFSGSGLTNDILNLTAVPLNTGFNITLTHIDMNGCVSTKSDQYTVYNHKNAIAALGTPSTLTGERQVCIKNQSFPSVSTNQVIVSDSVSADGLAGYKLLELFANIPTKATPGTQIMTYGSAWQALVQQIPVVYSAKPDANTGQTYRTYNWDYKPILNAGTLPGGLPNPYSFFVQPPTPLGKTYYKGGSLGIIEFTGKYHSKADFSVFIPVRQEVEVFIPAIPVVEQVTAPSSITSTGTLIYCEGIGSASDILINGYPAASPGSSTGIFTLLDSANLTPVDITVGSTVANGFTDNGNGTSSLKSSVTNNYRTIRVDYTYQDIGSPCSATGSFYIRITPNPRASFAATSVLTSANPIAIGRPSAVNAYCENNLIQFNNTSTFPASGYVANTNPQWTLGDPLSATNTQLTPSALFTYNTNGRYIVTFSVQSQYGCPSQVVSDSIYIGAIPNVSFSMNGISTAAPVNVKDNSTVADGPGTDSEIFSAQWKYSPSSAYITATNNTFTIPGHYTITLLSTTQITRTDQAGAPSLPGCERTFERPIIIVPAVSVLGGIEVVDDFESADPLTQWQSSSTNSLVSSWERGDATESSSIELASNVWATGLSTPYNPGEVSFLYSPAYDLSNLVRPKVSFDYAAFMGVNDGIVLEFSTDTFNIADPLKEWFRIGTNADGNNWYNRSGLASKPGTQKNVVSGIISGDYGWSAQLDTVLHSQHTLSPDIPAGKRTHVIFRFALASLSGSANQGFAFDNFRVGERTRIVLVENFTNKGNTQSLNSFNVEKRESDFLRDNFTGIGTDVVKINYHVGFPNLDPFNDDYPADPSARALFYNISETPLVRMDGGKSNDPQKKYISDWGIAEYNIRTLKLSQADLQITPPVISANGGYEFSVTVTANDPLSKDTTILHVAFVEASIPLSSLTVNDQDMVKTGESSFEYVLKKMVPSALGTRFGSALQTGQSRTFGPFEWAPDLGKLYNAPNDLAIVVFLQNEFTKEIYQAEILTSLTDPALVTDVEDPDYARKIQLFPNPANNEVNIQLPAAVTKSTAVEMFDTYGKNVYQSTFNVGEQIKTVSTSELTGGVYFIQLNTPDGNIARRKIMVIHR